MRRNVFPRVILALVAAIIINASSAFATTEKVLYNFTGGSDGQFPNSGVVFDKAGNLYGTTDGGGVVFQLSPNASGGWTETVLHTFAAVGDGAYPSGSLAFDSEGDLYGTTYGGASTMPARSSNYLLKPPGGQRA